MTTITDQVHFPIQTMSVINPSFPFLTWMGIHSIRCTGHHLLYMSSNLFRRTVSPIYSSFPSCCHLLASFISFHSIDSVRILISQSAPHTLKTIGTSSHLAQGCALWCPQLSHNSNCDTFHTREHSRTFVAAAGREDG